MYNFYVRQRLCHNQPINKQLKTSFVDELSTYLLGILSVCFSHIWLSSSVKIFKNVASVRNDAVDPLLLIPTYTTYSSRYDIENYIELNIRVGKCIFAVVESV
jgi:hypothetical protein